MDEQPDIQTYLAGISLADWKKFTARYGGGEMDRKAVIEQMRDPKLEQVACMRAKEVLGVTILTAEERRDQVARLSAQATLRQAASADEANAIAREANTIARQALDVANQAKENARWGTMWAWISAAVALVAFLLSFFGLLK